MAYIKFPIALRYSTAERFNGYGYDPVTGRVVSFKRDPEGARLEVRSSYNMNGWTIRHDEVKDFARAFPAVSVPAPKPPIAAAVRSVGSGPTFPYVMYSKKNQASQYFFAGTTIAEALERFAKRGEVIDPAEATIVNVETGKIHKLVPTTIYKLV